MAASLLGRITHRICSIPRSEAVTVASPATAPSRRRTTAAYPFALTRSSVTPAQ